ncbi:hypothetical protein Q4595_26905, partial [Wenyingzhuangia sp. 1_MG-2023]|nr:hypothetical protein [Wenyingzhuangia sp. 1_MG-2023]
VLFVLSTCRSEGVSSGARRWQYDMDERGEAKSKAASPYRQILRVGFAVIALLLPLGVFDCLCLNSLVIQ